MPPEHLLQIVPGPFREIGYRFLGYFIEAGLRPEHHLLDIGCGPGRIALPLAQYLNADGRYDGFDPMAASVAWCAETLSDPRFRFLWVDLHNEQYYPAGKGDASRYTFPYEDGCFDFACAISVFTHLSHQECCRYLAETRRVLRAGGTLFATWFIGRRAPAGGIAHEEAQVLAAYRESGLSAPSIQWGTWSGRASGGEYQEILICRA